MVKNVAQVEEMITVEEIEVIKGLTRLEATNLTGVIYESAVLDAFEFRKLNTTDLCLVLDSLKVKGYTIEEEVETEDFGVVKTIIISPLILVNLEYNGLLEGYVIDTEVLNELVNDYYTTGFEKEDIKRLELMEKTIDDSYGNLGERFLFMNDILIDLLYDGYLEFNDDCTGYVISEDYEDALDKVIITSINSFESVIYEY